MNCGPASKRRKLDNEEEGQNGFLSDFRFFIVEAGIGRARCDIFRKQIIKSGGRITDIKDCTHVIVSDEMVPERLVKILETEISYNFPVLKTKWLSTCLRENTIVDYGVFQLVLSSNLKEGGTKKKNILPESHSDVIATVKDTEGEQLEQRVQQDVKEGAKIDTSKPSTSNKLSKWVCSKSSVDGEGNHNQHITDKLKDLASIYEKSNDRWRALGYQKAITSLKKHPKPIRSWEEAFALPGVGKRLADKIWEIVQSGQLCKLEELNADSETRTIKMFTDIWGVGPTTAQQWLQQGYRTLDDLRNKTDLTHNQKVGLKYYDEFLERMLRTEAAEIEKVVVEAARTLQPGIVGMACGSYRRGRETCGDVDVLITHPDGVSHEGLFTKLLDHLHNIGFLTEDLVAQKDNGNQVKYLGVCKLPGQHTKHRRLDIIIVPYSEFACAQMYFTGSAHFNRSMRNLCKQRGMSLSEHSLNSGVIRKNGVKVHPGHPLQTPTEASIFEHLGLTYRSPKERDH